MGKGSMEIKPAFIPNSREDEAKTLVKNVNLEGALPFSGAGNIDSGNIPVQTPRGGGPNKPGASIGA